MRKLLAICVCVAVGLILSFNDGAAKASVGESGIVQDGPIAVGDQFTISNWDLATWYYPLPKDASAKDGSVLSGPINRLGENNVEWIVDLWGGIQIGWQMENDAGDGYPVEFVDLSNFESYTLSIHLEEGSSPLGVQLFMNTGFTGAGYYWWNDMYAQSEYIELNVCENTILDLDFSWAQRWYWTDDSTQIEDSWGPVDNLHQTTALGMKLYGDGEYTICIDTIPEPGTFVVWGLLGMASWLGMRVWRRRRVPVGRKPWSNENRTAILEIVDGR